MKTWIYSWFIYPTVYFFAKLWGLTNVKVRETLRLRSWEEFVSLRFNAGQPIEYWVHVASQGELEYALPILQEFDRRKKKVLVTYYSISAKQAVEQLPNTFTSVSLVVPLPHDGLGLMKDFVALVRKQGVHHLLLMKYELWPGLLWECNAQGIRVWLVDALRPGWFHRRLLHKLDAILAGYASEMDNVSHANVHVVGDTRVERVLQRVSESDRKLAAVVPLDLRSAFANHPTLVCGSMWPADTQLLVHAIRAMPPPERKFHVVWVPHELRDDEGRKAAAAFAGLGFRVCAFEELASVDAGNLPAGGLAIIVMKKGILAELYHLGQAAYVGGGFGSGVHSVWEPALTGAKVACGPRTRRSPEARELARLGLLVEVKDPLALRDWLRDSVGRPIPRAHSDSMADSMANLLTQHVGAARRIVELCEGTPL